MALPTFGSALGSAFTGSVSNQARGTVGAAQNGMANARGQMIAEAASLGNRVGQAGIATVMGNPQRAREILTGRPLYGSGGGNASPGNPMQGINARGDAVQDINWFCLPPQIPGASLPWYYVEAAVLPFREIEVASVYRRGHEEKYPDGYSVGDLSVTFFLDNTMAAMQYVTTWQSLVLANATAKDPRNQGRFGRARHVNGRGFYRDMQFHLLSVNKQKILSLVYYDCWPTSIDSFQVQSAEGNRMVLEVTFSVNDVDYLASTASSLGLPSNFTAAAQSSIGGAINQAIGYGINRLSTFASAIPDAVSNFFKPPQQPTIKPSYSIPDEN